MSSGLTVLVGGFCLLAGQVAAQTLTTLHSFSGSDGAGPVASLVGSSSNILYGTTQYGGSSGQGTVFAVNTDGSGFTILHSFSALTNYCNADGAGPRSGLLLLNNTLFGTTANGGSSSNGTVFAVNPDGKDFKVLHNFTGITSYTNDDGANPIACLVLCGNTLCGTAKNGGSLGYGTAFGINVDGTGFTNLHNFDFIDANPQTELTQISFHRLHGFDAGSNPPTVFGTTGNSVVGGIFEIDLLRYYSEVYFFADNTNGANPLTGLVLSDSTNTLYGMASKGGGSGYVFATTIDSWNTKILHNFLGPPSDGANPAASLMLTNETLYGTTSGGGALDKGTVFSVNTDGSGFTILYSFTGRSDGAIPTSGLIISGNTVFGTTSGGGSSRNGTVFSLSFQPQLTLTASGTKVVLTWPINFAGFDYTAYSLQSTTNLVSPVWTTNLPLPVVVNGRNTVTNPITGTQQYYRLAQY
jgi:uncharacterized repeat protein (TIGR03803 family)